jgi:hypothetical protein
MDDDAEPIERLEENSPHPADKTFNTLHDQGLLIKKQLREERDHLNELLKTDRTLEIQTVKANIAKKHNELMEILKHEEKICRGIAENNP